MGSPWGDDVVADRYDGHPGLVYAQRPRTFAELLFGVQRWAQRTFLVHGDPKSLQAMGAELRAKGHRVDIPEPHQAYEI